MWSTTSPASRTRSSRATFRRAWPSAWLTACSCALAVACGGSEQPPPSIPQGTAEALAARSDQVAEALARGDSCEAQQEAQALVEEAVAAINAGEVPPPLQEEVLTSAQSLAAGIECAPPPPVEEAEEEEDDDDDEGKGRGKGEDKGKGKGKDKKDKEDDD